MASDITAVLGLEPTQAADIGDLTRAGRAGRPCKPEYLTYQRTKWILDADEALIDPDDATGFAALRVLVDVLLPHADALERLRADCDTVISWSGDSDSSQGGFVLTADLLRDLATLGCPVFGTAFIDDERSSE